MSSRDNLSAPRERSRPTSGALTDDASDTSTASGAQLTSGAAGDMRAELPDSLYAQVAPAIEAALFAADRPLSLAELLPAVQASLDHQLTLDELEFTVRRLSAQMIVEGRGIVISALAGGWAMHSREEYADTIRVLYNRKPTRLSRAALEVLAIIAYRQPCTRADIDEIRGVDSSSSIRLLLDRELVQIIGKADDIGRPLIYGTAETFLKFFGLESLANLPTLRDLAEIDDLNRVQIQTLSETLAAAEELAEDTRRETAEPRRDDGE